MSHRFHIDFITISHQFHIDFIFTARSADNFFSTISASSPQDNPGQPPGMAPPEERDNPRAKPAHGAAGRDNPRDNPAHGAAGRDNPGTTPGQPRARRRRSSSSSSRSSTNCPGNPQPRPGQPRAPARSFASPRPHARHARHEPKPKSISRLGPLGQLKPLNLQYTKKRIYIYIAIYIYIYTSVLPSIPSTMKLAGTNACTHWQKVWTRFADCSV